MRIIALSCALLLCCLTASLAPADELARPVAINSLLKEMVDLQRLSVAPPEGLKCAQWSSYDRASVAPDKPGWFANGDAGQFIRQEKHGDRTEWVMAEMKGPGAIVRIWSANPDGGRTIRIYIDDLETPALETDFLKLTSGALPQFPAPFSARLSYGANLYFPLPYQERCKVTVDKPDGLYYHVGYRTYPAGTQMEPFSLAALPAVQATIAKVGAILADPAKPFTVANTARYEKEVTLPPGGTQVMHRFTGPAAVTRMELELEVPKEQLFAACRECALTIRFDDEDKPCVWAPLGDFFGSTPGINFQENLPVGMRKDGTCYCNWFMPFGKRAEISIQNQSQNPVNLTLTAWAVGTSFDPDKTLYFHAGWRNEWFPQQPEFLDWPMLEATGTGRFVGVMLGVMNTTSVWWGEGDEKVWVDDDTFPSYFGTGSEDYFGFAWCCPNLFTHAYHNESIVTGPGNFGYSAVARYHILDDIPFRSKMRFTIEKWDASPREYCCTTFWYASPGSTDFFNPVPVDKRHVLPLPEPFHVKGAVEGEKAEIARCTGGTHAIQQLSGEFSNGAHLWWCSPKVGDILEIKVPVAKAGKYKVTVGMTKSWDYGIHQLMINGQDVGQPVDFLASQVIPIKIELGTFDLQEGDMLFGLRCVGTNPDAKPFNYMAGIDYVLLEPQ